MEKLQPFMYRPLPEGLETLLELALDLRWTWNHGSDRLWQMLDPEAWQLTRNPWWILQSIPRQKLEKVAATTAFKRELARVTRRRKEYFANEGWFRQEHDRGALKTAAYFSMEFGLGEALPLYAGGLGILAGDHLKTASDLDIPIVGVGLLYQEGYFRQMIDRDGWQIDAHPHNDPTNMPISPVLDDEGGWLRVKLALPGRKLSLRVWQALIGRVRLYLLDSNDPANSPPDRSIIYKLYDDRRDFRLMQEMALGIAGWRLLKALGIRPEVCHLNEGHAAFVVLERTRDLMAQSGMSFQAARWATRAGNIFTTHTPVAAGFDSFPPDLITRYFQGYAEELGLEMEQFLALGRFGDRPLDPFNMAVLAGRGSGAINGVSRLHGAVSRRIFQAAFPRWPEHEVPVGHITNGVHVPTWDSEYADELWTGACGKGCWGTDTEGVSAKIAACTDQELWDIHGRGREQLIQYVRERLVLLLQQYGYEQSLIARAQTFLDPNILTLGFARRFASYKRPNLLLSDPERLTRLLLDTRRPVQLLVAGKAHPADEEGKRLVQQFVRFALQPEVRSRVVFIPDYDIALAQRLVQGIDLWINTPRRPWEACGTSGMKVLVNGGLNLSSLDGWWAEAYEPALGWAIGDGLVHDEQEDGADAARLYDVLENEVIPEFYDRDEAGVPVKWVARMRASLSRLTPRFSSNRMLREYIEGLYLPAAEAYGERTAEGGKLARALAEWQENISVNWSKVHFGNVEVAQKDDRWLFEVVVYTGDLGPDDIAVQLCAGVEADSGPVCQPMARGRRVPGAVNGWFYRADVPAALPAEHFTPRVIPAHSSARIPLEDHHILWQK